MICRDKNGGLTLTELIMVLVIMAITGAMAFANYKNNTENHKAKQAIATLRHIAQAVRLYVQEKKEGPFNIAQLEQTGYLDSKDYAPGFDYSILVDEDVNHDGLINGKDYQLGCPHYTCLMKMVAQSQTSNRTLTLQTSPTSSPDGQIIDSTGVLSCQASGTKDC